MNEQPEQQQQKPLKLNATFMEPQLVEQVSISLSSSKAFSNRLNSILDEYGFAIVENVIQETELADFERAFALDLLSMFAVDKTNPEHFAETFGFGLPPPFHQYGHHASTKYFANKLQQDPAVVQKVLNSFPLDNIPIGSMFFSDWGIAQGRLAWKTRLHRNVQKVFTSIYDDCSPSDLCTGTDVIFFENRDPPKQQLETRLWPHTDQNRFVLPGGDHRIFQSLVYIWGSADPATRDNASTTVVWPKSHKQQYDELMNSRDWSNSRSHYCRWPEEKWDEFSQNARRVPVPSGAMLVFASNLIHQGWNPVPVSSSTSERQPGCGRRLSIPISMEPKALRSHEALSEKISALVSGNPTTHWASLGLMTMRIRKDGFEFENTTKKYVVRAQIHHHFRVDDKETSEFWKDERNRHVGVVEKGANWFRSTLLPHRFGGMRYGMPFDSIPPCVLDML